MENSKTVIQINQTTEAILVSPKMHGRMALVDLKTLKRISSYLGNRNLAKIKENILNKVANSQDLEQLVEFMKDEINFHDSVNLINTIEVGEDVTESKH